MNTPFSGQERPSVITPSSRYVLPEFSEKTSNGERIMNPYAKLFDERIIFLATQVDDASASDVMSQLLVLEAMDPDRDITMYINSPGGSLTACLAIYDTMQYVRPDITTVCLGMAASAAAVLLAAGSPGKRAALPNSTILIHQPRVQGGSRGMASDIEIEAAEIERKRNKLDEILARHTGQTTERVREDTDRDKYMTADEAKDYGLVDVVFDYRKASS